MAVISQQPIVMSEKKKEEKSNIILNIQHIYWTDKFTIRRQSKISANIHSITYIIMIPIKFW